MAKPVAKRFFITKMRLHNENFYKAVTMVKTINPSADIMMPKVHQTWFVDGGYKDIGVENAYMVLDYLSEYGRECRWGNDVTPENKATTKFFATIIERDYTKGSSEWRARSSPSRTVQSVLSSPQCPEDMLTSFIADKFGNKEMMASVEDYFNAIYENKHLKAYQVELLYRKVMAAEFPKSYRDHKENILQSICQKHLRIMPNDVLEELLPRVLSYDKTQHYGDPYTEFMREAYRRGYLVRGTPVIHVSGEAPKKKEKAEVKEVKLEMKATTTPSGTVVIKY